MTTKTTAGWCAIDFGTSNSALVVGANATPVPLEGGETSMPTAVFYFTDEHEAVEAGAVQVPGAPPRAYGRAAVRAYVEGHAGRLMRSIKSILGSALANQSTELGDGHGVRFLDVVVGYLRHLRGIGEAAAGHPLDRVLLGRPVRFVDDDATLDAQAQSTLEQAAHAAGFREVRFQFEPIAAALDYERRVEREQLVLVCDIGGGTSDFSVVRVGPRRRAKPDRRDDILANHGVHIAGTDFDRRIELAAVMPLAGFRARGPDGDDGQPGREVPHAIYFDLATWHLINTCYRPQRVAEQRRMSDWYADPALHRRLMRILDERLGHDLAARSEAAKIAAASGGGARIDLSAVERDLRVLLSERDAVDAIDADLGRIVDAARETAALAGVAGERIHALYFTGGSTGLAPLTARIAAAFPAAVPVAGERLASVASGLGVDAARRFAAH